MLGSETDGNTWIDPITATLAFHLGSKDGSEVDYYGEGKSTVVEFIGGADTGIIRLEDIDGNELELEIFRDSNNLIAAGTSTSALGTDRTDLIITPGDANRVLDCNTGTATATDCEKIQFFTIGAGEQMGIVELSDVDIADNKVTFQILDGAGEGSTYERTLVVNVTTAYDLGSLGSPMVNITDQGLINVVDAVADGNGELRDRAARLTFGGVLNATGGAFNASFPTAVINLTINFTEDAGTNIQHGTAVTWTLSPGYDTTDNELTLTETDGTLLPGFATNLTSGALENSKDDTNWKTGMSVWGTLFEDRDTRERTAATLTFPLSQIYAQLYVLPVLAGASSESAVVSGAKLLESGATVANTLASGSKAIVVGGPAVNPLAAELLGVPFPSYGDASKVPSAGLAQLHDLAGDVDVLLIAGLDESLTLAKAVKAGTATVSKVEASAGTTTGTA